MLHDIRMKLYIVLSKIGRLELSTSYAKFNTPTTRLGYLFLLLYFHLLFSTQKQKNTQIISAFLHNFEFFCVFLSHFQNTSFLLFLNKFDLFEQKARKVPLSVCEWFKDYEPSISPSQEIDHAYEYVSFTHHCQ